MNRPGRLRLPGVLFALLGGALLLALFALGSGSLALSPSQVLAALLGEAPRGIELVVTQWRLPRVALALLIGAALGLSGALFQSLLRNPLGSPDIMGFNTGAYSGVLVALVLFQASILWSTTAALIGGLLSAALVYALTWRGSGVDTLRLIIVGIGVRALLMALNTWLIVHASLEAAFSAGLWSAGSLNGLTWGKAWPAVVFILLAGAASLALSRRLFLLEMGDDTACALGVPVERTRLSLLGLGVVLTAAGTAVAGPISFIALAAPQIARRLTGTQRLALPAAALTGAVLLLGADLLAQRLFLPYVLPVGLVTVSLGGLYLIGLLIWESRRS
ncbi:ABC-type enterobactin transport system permease subunit [Pseudomonas sp. SORGH_AS199]|uniref:Iron-enterobactin ABC transporter permease n=1 Tax=Pseudomonas flavocrustae TaxID=2991719 RepID=A0ABT6IBQ1_9PSED|nr:MULTISPECIES: iron-enterobactin ABC transporter permease [unclassified Pseudomonas]MDH4761811.1 iron-enterobactin ABC transporter permease [Pseudomonas sp. CBMAI 2609]MDR6231108.1 ABC-type enterobactin transport system permease subunit [Pseudomonas sp. SORGH_AS_0199]